MNESFRKGGRCDGAVTGTREGRGHIASVPVELGLCRGGRGSPEVHPCLCGGVFSSVSCETMKCLSSAHVLVLRRANLVRVSGLFFHHCQ